MGKIQMQAQKMQEIHGLNSFPVGVKFIFEENVVPATIEKLLRHRYCQAMMKARHGDHVLLDAEGIACPAAAAVAMPTISEPTKPCRDFPSASLKPLPIHVKKVL
jgi:uncharacterized protein (DUF169 family)